MSLAMTNERSSRRQSHASRCRWEKVQDKTAATRPGRDGFMRSHFSAAVVDPEGQLDAEELEAAIARAKSEYFSRLRAKSGKVCSRCRGLVTEEARAG